MTMGLKALKWSVLLVVTVMVLGGLFVWFVAANLDETVVSSMVQAKKERHCQPFSMNFSVVLLLTAAPPFYINSRS
ncbi:hypothetical protein QL185_14010 [Cronobacter malonaticus]|uniref:hypothetical protein n=1 Tax=Cronobacter malonaticus TaxID=413503 RepID=UPI0024ADE5BA|nr:hypothetical protein [Cronobacter malonaticus]MDI6460657.1 hypothetical protein [Cronobacter malonaticus]